MSGNSTPAGWYPATDRPGDDRYWDGAQWTDSYRPSGGGFTPPPGPMYGAMPGQMYGPPPDNYLVWAILSTLFCCLPFGIVSIVKSSQVNNLWMQGRMDEARQAANAAKQWAWVSAGVGIVVSLLYVSLVVVAETNSSGF